MNGPPDEMVEALAAKLREGTGQDTTWWGDCLDVARSGLSAALAVDPMRQPKEAEMGDRAETLKPQWDENMVLNREGRWVPAIPHPFYIGFRLRKTQCSCGRKFKNVEAYKGHYAYVHIVLGHGFDG